MFYRFRCESEFYPALSRVPLHARMKLDLAGVKLSLKDWLAFSFEERTVLCHFPVDAEEEMRVFIAYLEFLSEKYLGAPLWIALASAVAASVSYVFFHLPFLSATRRKT